MKLYRKALRIWITITSLISFLIGWVFLSHIPDSALSTTANTDTTTKTLNLPAIPSVNGPTNTNQNGNGVQLFSFIPSTTQTQSQAASPAFRTRGS
jgi:hypothetical protein